MLSFTLSGKHIHGRPITLIVTSLYICISYNCTYSYNFYYLSSLHAYCMSTFFPLHVLCLWHSSYLYFSCIFVSILCIFHIHSITYCSMSLTYLLSILLLYSCLSHILCLFLVICLYLILDLFHIIFCIIFFASFLYFHVHVRILCIYHILSYLVYFHITYLILSYTFIYILILFIYGTFVCFHLILFMYCIFICLLPVSSLFHLSVL